VISKKKFLILAGGFGTRISDEIGGLPKALAPVNGKPFLFYQMNNWISKGINDFTFLLFFKSDLIIKFLEQYKQKISQDISLRYIVEKEPLGTGGAILHAMNQSQIKRCLIINADTWIESGYKKMFEASKSSILIANVENAARFGRVILDKKRNVLNFAEKDGFMTPGLINAGFCSLTIDDLNLPNKVNFSLETDVLIPLARATKLKAIISDKNFFDIGVPEDLNFFRKYIKNNT
tara:strand:+ start:1211 stop:1915 length:705 start_codon:yes stop_codon:yes gene_type:complete